MNVPLRFFAHLIDWLVMYATNVGRWCIPLIGFLLETRVYICHLGWFLRGSYIRKINLSFAPCLFPRDCVDIYDRLWLIDCGRIQAGYVFRFIAWFPPRHSGPSTHHPRVHPAVRPWVIPKTVPVHLCISIDSGQSPHRAPTASMQRSLLPPPRSLGYGGVPTSCTKPQDWPCGTLLALSSLLWGHATSHDQSW